MLGELPYPGTLLANGRQADAAAARLGAAEAPAGNRQVAQRRRFGIDHGAVAAFLAGHLDLETLALELGECGRGGRHAEEIGTLDAT
jgi:hypothetical protein